MSKLLILGSKGMLGQMLVQVFRNDKNYKIVAWDKEDLDITDEKEVTKKIESVKPKIIINAAAYTDVDKAETNQDLIIKINGNAVGYLVKASRKIDACFIHISTDYVFDGKKEQGYQENDLPQNSLNIYGKSKFLGEQLILKEATKGLKYYLIRTSWLFGPGGKNFVATIIELAKKQSELKIVNDQHGKPTYTKDLAKIIKYLIESDLELGIYHFTNEPALTWYDFAKIIFDAKKEIDPGFLMPKIYPIDSENFSRPAKRPKYSILLNTKLPKGRNVKIALRDYLRNTKI